MTIDYTLGLYFAVIIILLCTIGFFNLLFNWCFTTLISPEYQSLIWFSGLCMIFASCVGFFWGWVCGGC